MAIESHDANEQAIFVLEQLNNIFVGEWKYMNKASQCAVEPRRLVKTSHTAEFSRIFLQIYSLIY